MKPLYIKFLRTNVKLLKCTNFFLNLVKLLFQKLSETFIELNKLSCPSIVHLSSHSSKIQKEEPSKTTFI